MEINKKMIGKRIKHRREICGLSQEQLAEKLNLSKNHISTIECGKSLITTAHLCELCNILGETPNYYLMGMPTSGTDPIHSRIAQLAPKEQTKLCRLLDVYLESTND